MTFLNICIPTYTRSAQLCRQLTWLGNEIRSIDRPERVEILILDNASTDDTEQVVSKWRQSIHQNGIVIRYIRNETNIGGMRNLARCIEESSGQFTWTIGDDDIIESGTLAFVLNTLENNPALALLFLNFSDIDVTGQSTLFENWFPVDLEKYYQQGKAVFERSLAYQLGSVMFLTSTIYRTELPQAALLHWRESVGNWGGQIFWTGFCATRGPVLVTRHCYVKCLMGTSHWLDEEGVWTRIYFRDLPEIYNMLYSVGYSAAFCGGMLMQNKNNILETQKNLFIGYAKILKHGLKWNRIAAKSLFILAMSWRKSDRFRQTAIPDSLYN